MKYIILSVFLILFTTNLKAQKVELLTIDNLNKRIEQGKDTTYVINFWATWCAPCVEELPYFEKLNSNFQKDKLKVLLVSVDFKSKLQSAVQPFTKKHKLKSEVFLLNEPNQQEYIDKIDISWSGSIPATLFINKAKGVRKFFEKEFSYDELVNQFNLII